MTTKTLRPRDRFLEAMDACYGAFITAIETSEDRGDRASKILLAEARKGEKELLALTRGWVDAPGHVFENLEAMIDAQARAQRRALELARDSLRGAGTYRTAVQEALRDMIKANRSAGEAVMEVARDAAKHAAQRPEQLPRPRRMRARAVRRTAHVPVVETGVPQRLAG